MLSVKIEQAADGARGACIRSPFLYSLINVEYLEEDAITGDVNGDGILNVLDIVQLVNIVLYSEEYNETGDMNNDGILNVLDIVLLVNTILNS